MEQGVAYNYCTVVVSIALGIEERALKAALWCICIYQSRGACVIIDQCIWAYLQNL